MSWFYKELIKSGADLVLGSHAPGVYPIETYKEKHIVYSLGYLMHDTDLEIGKKSAIFNFTIDVEGKLKSIEVIPTYIQNKEEVLLYYDYNKDDAIEFLKMIGKNMENSKIQNGKLLIEI